MTKTGERGGPASRHPGETGDDPSPTVRQPVMRPRGTYVSKSDMVTDEVLRDHIAAISCGVCSGTAVLDLDYAEDSQAETDANFVLTGSGHIVEVQATAEKVPFSEEQLTTLLALARKGVAKLIDLQKMAVM